MIFLLFCISCSRRFYFRRHNLFGEDIFVPGGAEIDQNQLAPPSFLKLIVNIKQLYSLFNPLMIFVNTHLHYCSQLGGGCDL